MNIYTPLLPDMGPEDTILLNWLVEPGDIVAVDDVLLHVTVPGDVGEIYAEHAGRVLETFGKPLDVIEPNMVLAIIDRDDTGQATVGADAGGEGHGGPAAAVPRVAFTLSPFIREPDLAKAEAAVVAAEAVQSPADRLELAAAVYDVTLREAWSAFVAGADRYADDIEAEELRCQTAAKRTCAEIASRLDAEQNKADTRREQELARGLEEIAIARRAADECARSLWNRIGRGLDLEEPEPELAERRTAVAGEMVDAPAELDQLTRRAEQQPAILPANRDPALVSYPWWAAGGGLLFGWIAMGFVGGLVLGCAAGAGVYFVRQQARSAAAALYRDLLAALVQQHAANHGDLARRRSTADAELEAAAAERGRTRAGAARQCDADLAGIAQAVKQARTQGSEHIAAAAARVGGVIGKISALVEASRRASPGMFAEWTDLASAAPPDAGATLAERMGVRIGEYQPDPLCRSRLGGAAPALEAAGPLLWRLGQNRSLLISEAAGGGDSPHSVATPVLLRLLQQMPPGKVLLTVFDPLGLGRNFAPFLALGDKSAQLIGTRIWTNKEHLRGRLGELTEHIERVTQKYLQAKFQSIEEYCADNSEVPEPYRILVIEDFPTCFDEDTVRELGRILQNGPRCGVYVVLHRDESVALPRGVDLGPLLPLFLQVSREDGAQCYRIAGGAREQFGRLDASPDPELAAEIVGQFGSDSIKALEVKVDYAAMLGKAGASAIWSASSANGISVPLGMAGGKIRSLELGKELSHHALVVGRPGSGKSNLLHVFITTAARLYSPGELELYLIDFKQGVEFKPYADALLPHAHAIALQSEREFGLSVLQGLEAEMTRRGSLFAAQGVQNISEYRAAIANTPGAAPMPRIVLVVDEFQQFFIRDDRIKRESAIVMARLVSQARYSGIHLIFATQSLATATLERAIRDQMTVRIALQCSETDSKLILSEDNTAARTLTRAGEGIYNDQAGLKEGNILFQAAAFSEIDRTRELSAIRAEGAAGPYAARRPIIFAGHEPGDIEACAAIVNPFPSSGNAPKKPLLWLGESTSLKPMATPPLTRQPGRNLLVLTREESEGTGVIIAALLSLAVQFAPDQASFEILDLTSSEAPWADHPEEFADEMPHDVEVLGRHQARDMIARLEAEVRLRVSDEEHRREQTERQQAAAARDGKKRRAAVPGADGNRLPPAIFVVLLGLHRVRDLRAEERGATRIRGMTDDAVAAPTDTRKKLVSLLKDGPEVGVHVLIWCDTLANLERAIDRASLDEIGIRVAGPMSDQESRRLFDSDAAFALDKPHRLVLGDDARVGAPETFRPFAVASYDRIRTAAAAIAAPGQTAIIPLDEGVA